MEKGTVHSSSARTCVKQTDAAIANADLQSPLQAAFATASLASAKPLTVMRCRRVDQDQYFWNRCEPFRRPTEHGKATEVAGHVSGRVAGHVAGCVPSVFARCVVRNAGAKLTASVYVCMWQRTCVCVCTYVCMHTCMCVCVCVCARLCGYHAYVCVSICLSACLPDGLCVHMSCMCA